MKIILNTGETYFGVKKIELTMEYDGLTVWATFREGMLEKQSNCKNGLYLDAKDIIIIKEE